jgi:predicted house-cleaning noncanonical NTP pyrophosphatase (MazG superfamily)
LRYWRLSCKIVGECIKLVRDRIPAISWKNGDDPSFRVAEENEKAELLNEKIQEEVDELIDAVLNGTDKDIARELADIVEVVQAMGNYYQVDVIYTKNKKSEERGSFNDWIVME